jgi:hypothetical protein
VRSMYTQQIPSSFATSALINGAHLSVSLSIGCKLVICVSCKKTCKKVINFGKKKHKMIPNGTFDFTCGSFMLTAPKISDANSEDGSNRIS